MQHLQAIRILEDHCVSLDILSEPTPNTVTQFYADRCQEEAKAIRQTIEFLRSLP
jgi:hypothetical protein